MTGSANSSQAPTDEAANSSLPKNNETGKQVEKRMVESTAAPSHGAVTRATTIEGKKAEASGKRKRSENGNKVGLKPGQRVNCSKTMEDWYHACQKFLECKKKNGFLTRKAFLESKASGDKFSGHLIEQQSFGRYLKKFENGELKPTNQKRSRQRRFKSIEEKMFEHLEFRVSAFKRARCGLSWAAVQKKCKEYADELGMNEFQASPGWIADTLRNFSQTPDGRDLPLDQDIETEIQETLRQMESATAEENKEHKKTASRVAPETAGGADAVTATQQKSETEVESHIQALHEIMQQKHLPGALRYHFDQFAQGIRMHSQQHNVHGPGVHPIHLGQVHTTHLRNHHHLQQHYPPSTRHHDHTEATHPARRSHATHLPPLHHDQRAHPQGPLPDGGVPPDHFPYAA